MSIDTKELTYINFDCNWQCCYQQTTDHVDNFINILFSNNSDVNHLWSSVRLPHIIESCTTHDNCDIHGSHDWWYRKEFDWILSDQQQKHQVYLLFESNSTELNINATIWFNGEKILLNSSLLQQNSIDLTDKLLRYTETTEKNKHNNVLIVHCIDSSLSLHARLIIHGTVIWATGQVKTNDDLSLKIEKGTLDYAVRANDADQRIGVVFNQSETDLESSSLTELPVEPISDETQIEENSKDISIPHLNIVILIVGTRGDVQPFIALGKALLEYGHRVRLATHETFRSFVRDNGLEFYPLAGDPADLMSFMVKNAGIIPSMSSIVAGDITKKRRILAEILASTWLACTANDDETSVPFTAEAIIANPPSFGHIHCAEKLQIPLHIMFTMPWTPTSAFPHPLCNIDSSRGPTGKINFYSYSVVEMLTWSGMRGIVNSFRKKILGLSPLHAQQATNALIDERVPHTYCWSPSLVARPSDWESHIDVSGFFFLDLCNTFTNPPQDLLDFLGINNDDSNDPKLPPLPIYIGFGSITGHDSCRLLEVIKDALNRTGNRAVLSGFETETDSLPDNIFKIGNVPHDWLFQHVSAVCHHGGAGTTAAGLRAGKPTIIVPFFGDQFFWGNVIEKSGAGPRPLPGKSVTASELAEAFQFVHLPTTREAAERIRQAMEKEDGCQAAVRAFHVNLPINRMRSDLQSTFTACYRIDNFNLQISRPVAHALVAAGAIDVSQLRSHYIRRWQFKHDHKRHRSSNNTSENITKPRSHTMIDGDTESRLRSSTISNNNSTTNTHDDASIINSFHKNGDDSSMLSSSVYSNITNGSDGFSSLNDTHSELNAKHEPSENHSKTSFKTSVYSVYRNRKLSLINYLKRSRVGHQQPSQNSITADALIATTEYAMQPVVCSLFAPMPQAKVETSEIDETDSKPNISDIVPATSLIIPNGEEHEEDDDDDEISPNIKIAAEVSGFHPKICQQIIQEFEQIKTKQNKLLTNSFDSKQHHKHLLHLQRQRSHSLSNIN
ncbi:unnamed protein product [Adineta steineri]|uniref:Sterol 3-beta-glucosyltransferase n=1 Tax=Adineta steineri TaxID=433720 RepID=A0A813W5N0_9BILA|nr:unnamed protein product [Adineta steineri]